LNIKIELKLSFQWDKNFHGEVQEYQLILTKFNQIVCSEAIMFTDSNKREPINVNFMVAIKPDDVRKFGLPEFLTI
jgi:hypothetical protein